MVITRILTDWNLHDVILSLNEFYIQSYFSIKKRDRHTNKQTYKPDPPSEIDLLGGICLTVTLVHTNCFLNISWNISFLQNGSLPRDRPAMDSPWPCQWPAEGPTPNPCPTHLDTYTEYWQRRASIFFDCTDNIKCTRTYNFFWYRPHSHVSLGHTLCWCCN